MKPKIVNCFVILIVFLSIFVISRAWLIAIPDGFLDGNIWTTKNLIMFHAFLKIPYAQPPIGNLRFQPPLPNTKWTGILNAKEWGPMCIQRNPRFPMSEDCLYLNVFTRVPSIFIKRPVIVYFHGGSFEVGSSQNHKPHYMMGRDVVLVTVNYRSGAFGFLSTGTKEAPGNVGLKDQVMALKWVKKNIMYFGGDPNKVTLAGLSSGSILGTAHMASNMSVDLFHRVIAMSGTIGSFGKMNNNTLNLALFLANAVKCPTANITEMVGCLQQKPAANITAVVVNPATKCPFGPTWQPVIEKDFGQERFLAQHPFISFQSGNYTKVPVLAGITENEMYRIVPLILSDPRVVKFWSDNLNQFSAECFSLEKFTTTSKLFRQMYVPRGSISAEQFNNIGNMVGDGIIAYGVHRFVHMISSQSDTYYYKFIYRGRYSIFNYPRKVPYGVEHSDDLQYVFETNFIGPQINCLDPENLMVERMTRIWEQFATDGNPNNPNDLYLSSMVWPKHNSTDEYYLEIGPHFVEKKGLFLERFNAFDDLMNNSG